MSTGDRVNGGAARDGDRVPGRGGADTALWRHPAFRYTLAAGCALALVLGLFWDPLEAFLLRAEFSAASLLDAERIRGAGAIALPLIGFAGGLLASFSPCILPLVPLNLAYIGAKDARGWRALGPSLRFAAGAALALSVLGLFGSLAGLLLVAYRGVTLLVLGVLLLVFALATLELIPLPLFAGGGGGVGAGRRLGPIAAGAAFALVTTPCTSPILGAVLSAASAQALPGLAIVTMISFSLGYTALVIVGGLAGGGLIAWVARFRWVAPRAAAAALFVVAGLTLIATGLRWF